MDQLNEYARKQESYGQEIKKLFSNMTKDAQERKTPDYIRRRTETLQELWKNVEIVHAKMEAIKNPTHVYFTACYLEQLNKAYQDALQYIKDCKKAKDPSRDEQVEIDDPEQAKRIKRQGVRMKKVYDLLDKARLLLSQEDSKKSFNYLQSQLQTQMENVRTLEEDIQVNELQFQAKYFTEDKYRMCEKEFELVMEELIKVSNEQRSHNAPSFNQHPTIPLPKLTLPTFDGTYENWTSFHDLFNKIIHLNKSITNVEKMQYLKTHLQEEPSRIIQHLQVADNNYVTAWTILKNRYENNRLILAKLLDKILDLPSINTENAEKIKSYHDTTAECLQAINNLGIPTDSWGPIVGRILVKKWDNETNKLYELSLKNPNEIQQFNTLMDFLKMRFQSLEAISDSQKKIYQPPPVSGDQQHYTCRFCQEYHSIYTCQDFRKLPISRRIDFIRSRSLCTICLNHDIGRNCQSAYKCKFCRKPHSTLLHQEDKNFASPRSTQKIALVSTSKKISLENKSNAMITDDTVLLATALVKVKTASGRMEYIRVLIDPGSQASFITEEAAQMLAIPRQKIHAKISGLEDGKPRISNWKVETSIYPHFPSKYSLNINFLILPKLTTFLPNETLPESDPKNWFNKILADPTYSTPGPIDAIIGAEEYGNIIQGGLHRTEEGLLGQRTELGWILSGNIKIEKPATSPQITSLVNRVEEDAQLTKFGEIEKVNVPRILNKADSTCEKYYEETTHKNSDGTYTVQIPFKQLPVLGSSKPRAIARLHQLENRLKRNTKLKTQYNEFMEEDLKLSHMKKITHQDNPAKYYIPNHSVQKKPRKPKPLQEELVIKASDDLPKLVSEEERNITRASSRDILAQDSTPFVHYKPVNHRIDSFPCHL